jgi:hypothetical protein
MQPERQTRSGAEYYQLARFAKSLEFHTTLDLAAWQRSVTPSVTTRWPMLQSRRSGHQYGSAADSPLAQVRQRTVGFR